MSYNDYRALVDSGEEVNGLYVPPKMGSINLIPKDIQTIDWSWSVADSSEILNSHGFYRLYGNFCAASMPSFNDQVKNKLRGISYSNWGANDYDTLQRTASIFSTAYNWLAVWGGDFDSTAIKNNTMAVSRFVFNYINRKALLSKHIKITHSTSAIIDHPYFYDGFLIIKEDYRIGDYEIEYTDGAKETFPIYWGHNIGQSKVRWSKTEHGSADEGFAVKYIYEPIGESCPVLSGDLTRYETVLPVKGEIKDVKLISREGFDIDFVGYEVVEP